MDTQQVEELVNAAPHGDSTALAEICEEFHPQIYRYMLRRDPATQRPVVQRAIDMCGERSRWMRRTPAESVKTSPPRVNSCWGDGCGWD